MSRPFAVAATVAILGVAVSAAQNITNTLGTGGSFVIRDGTSVFLAVDQATGTLTVHNGQIFHGANRFIHSYGTNNTFVGINAGNFTLTGASLTAVGTGALLANTIGRENTAVGHSALAENTSGSFNAACGFRTLTKNSTGEANSAFGIASLFTNVSGSFNCAFGNVALYNNDSHHNSAFGDRALYANTIGSSNCAFGKEALKNNVEGAFNVAVGVRAGLNTKGSNNIIVGSDADVPNLQGNNQVRIGDQSILYAGIQVAWSITSDRRWKENIVPSGLGLGFIRQLHPVSYTRTNDQDRKTEFGLLAQEVDEVLRRERISNAAMLTIDGTGRYELRYNDLLAPMIRAIQELSAENARLAGELGALTELRERVAKLESMMYSPDTRVARHATE